MRVGRWFTPWLVFAALLPALVQGANVGQPAPDFELPSLVDNDSAQGISLRQFRGNVVYVDFWASWCGPCRTSFPQLELIRRELHPRGFEIVAISVDEFRADAVAFLEDVPVSYPVVHDPEGATPRAYGILGMPSGYLLDREGVIQFVHQGFRKSDGAKLRKKIIGLLGE